MRPDEFWDGFVRDLKRFDLDVRRVKGFSERGDAGADFVAVGLHHTASPRTSGDLPCAGIVTHGRGGADPVPGPLCNILLGRLGTVLLVAKHKANHFGLGGPLPGVPLNMGNPKVVGIECENNGVDEPWGKDLRRSIAVVSAVSLFHLDQPAKMLYDHKRYTSRKVDVRGLDMGKMTHRVQGLLQELRAA